MIIMGDGIASSGAQEELAELAAFIGAEVWGADSSEVNINTLKPNYKGLLGHMFGYNSQPITSQADAVLIIGTYILPEVFPELEGVFCEKASIIHIDLDDYEIAKNFPVDIGIVSDPKITLGRLIEAVKSSASTKQKAKIDTRQKKLVQEKEAEISKLIESDKKLTLELPMHPARFMQALSKQVPDDTVIFDEALTCSPELNRYIPPVRPGHFFQTRGGSLGVGIPGAIGLKLAAPDRTVIGLTGDGASMYTFQALWTAAHHNIGAKFIVCNNHSYLLLKLNILAYWKEREIQEHDFPDMFDIMDPDIDFTGLSRGLGVPALKIDKPEGIEPGIKQMLEADGPFLLDLLVQTEDDI
jgi:benzoylformate decarboxylase